ncbi:MULTISPECIES: DNA polymerase III subunit chi [unclassified Minwuia]|jgi:DNA polymerase III subunit chi|uniref:DNA polymerase III subunit chi n=1 Tax=unclassified Minwuia TaxID=2618799 RepID=UPI00247A2188|nr:MULTISPECIES: DNA polymerase III subunit chi [unclassified Minwuia]
MADVAFYHLTRKPLETALPELLEKVVERGMKAVVRAGDDGRVKALNDLLWIYRKDAFLPHGCAEDGHGASQPVWLTSGADNPAGATVLLLVDGVAAADLEGYDRCLDLFDGRDEDAVAGARDRWRMARSAGHSVTYWKQGERGWEKGA